MKGERQAGAETAAEKVPGIVRALVKKREQQSQLDEKEGHGTRGKKRFVQPDHSRQHLPPDDIETDGRSDNQDSVSSGKQFEEETGKKEVARTEGQMRGMEKRLDGQYFAEGIKRGRENRSFLLGVEREEVPGGHGGRPQQVGGIQPCIVEQADVGEVPVGKNHYGKKNDRDDFSTDVFFRTAGPAEFPVAAHRVKSKRPPEKRNREWCAHRLPCIFLISIVKQDIGKLQPVVQRRSIGMYHTPSRRRHLFGIIKKIQRDGAGL